MDRFFDVWFPKIFITMFVVIISVILLQVGTMIYAVIWVTTTPDAAATIGNMLGDVVRPVADAVKGQ
jgi:hypothetical protein